MTRLLLVAAALVMGIAAAGVGDGAEWDVYPGESVQDATCGAGGDTIYVRMGTNAHECGCGDGADVRTADTKILM